MKKQSRLLRPLWLVDEVDEALLEALARSVLEQDPRTSPDVRLARVVDPVEQLEVDLVLDLRERLAHGFADEVPVTDELMVGRIRQLEDVLGAAQDRPERRGLFEDRPEPLDFLARVLPPMSGVHLFRWLVLLIHLACGPESLA